MTGIHDRYKQGKMIEASEVQDNLKYRTPQKPKDTEKNPIKTLILDSHEDYMIIKPYLERYNQAYCWVSYLNV